MSPFQRCRQPIRKHCEMKAIIYIGVWIWIASKILQSDFCGVFVERHPFLAIFAAIILFVVFVCGYGAFAVGNDSKTKRARTIFVKVETVRRGLQWI